MERLAIDIGDTAALCGDVAYQLGQVVCEASGQQLLTLPSYGAETVSEKVWSDREEQLSSERKVADETRSLRYRQKIW